MGTYPAAAWSGVSPNRSPREGTVRYFIVHHYAGTTGPSTARARFMRANDRNVSPNWQVNADGTVYEIVPPDKWRAWTSGAVDHEAVTVETQNTTGTPNWGISDASHEAIAELVAWAAARYGFPIDRAHVFGHSEISAKTAHTGNPTACPGPSMDLDRIVSRARHLGGTMAGLNGMKAARTLQNWGPLAHPGACLYYVWLAYKAHGAQANGTYPTAYDAWLASPGKHHGDRNPPPGVPVYWGPRAGSRAGDVVISLGGGRVVATDYPRYGVVGTCTIAQREAQIGRPYLGWTDNILGYPIRVGTPAGEEEDDDMSARAEKKIDELHDLLIDPDHNVGTGWFQRALANVAYSVATKGKGWPRDGSTVASVELTQAMTETILDRLGSTTTEFYRHGDMPEGSSLWLFVTPTGDFVRIRDADTAALYKEMNGGFQSKRLSKAAIRLLRDNLLAAGGRDLTAVEGTNATTVTTSEEDAADFPDDETA